MSWLNALALLSRPPDLRPTRVVEQEILDELEFHIQMRTLDNLSAGMSAPEARQDAVRRFGDFERIRKACRQTQLGERIMLQRLESLAEPSVVQTVPKTGDTDVDPSLTEIRVTYNKEMMDGSWSWSQVSDETFPETTGEPRYEADHKTCVLPVKLYPGKTYVIWLNSEKFHNFKDAKGRSAVPYLLVFETTK